MDEHTQLVALITGPAGALGVAVWLIRWLMGKFSELQAQQRETLEKLSGVIERNTVAMVEVRTTIARCPGYSGADLSDPAIKVPH